MLELDHVFCFVDRALPEAGLLEGAGYLLTPPRQHEGQGTGNRSVLFARNYLELIYLDDRSAAEGNPVRLDRHADHVRTGFSPFGVALRGDLPAEDRSNFWEYRPGHWGGNVAFPVCKSQQHGSTVVLVVDRVAPPASWPGADAMLRHGRDMSGIERVRLEGPNVDWPLSAALPEVELVEAASFHMTVFLQGGAPLRPALRLNPVLTLV